MKRSFKRVLCALFCVLLIVSSSVSAFALPVSNFLVQQRVKQMVQGMTLEQKVAQMVMGSVNPSNATALQNKYQFGAIILFDSYFANSTSAQVKESLKNLKSASPYGLLIAVDEEGGTVNRVSKFSQFRSVPFASPKNVYQQGGWTAITTDTLEKALFLKNLGINTNLAPVADVPYKASNYMYNRAFSTNANEASTYVQKVTTAYNSMGLVSCLKHFPGYGGNGNTHTAVIHDKRAKSTFESRDLLPFKAGIQAGAPMVLVSHNIVDCYDKTNPASLSPAIHRLLRTDLGFSGVILTDGLEMDGVEKAVGSASKVAVQAVLAGNDMLCTQKPVTHYNAVLKAVKNGTITEAQINDSVQRILQLKMERGLLI